jgi:dimethylamine/trimethylamine dehydrogenase
MGEEWRRKWHPERIPSGDPGKNVLIVGAGPAGLECARALGQRGLAVTVAEASEELGGRITNESKLPGLATWARVRDYRTNLIKTMGNVDVYRDSPVSAPDVIEFGCDYVVIATGARWTRQILDTNEYPGGEIEGDAVFTPDDILAGAQPEGPVVIYDFDHYYMGSCLAERLRLNGNEVTLVTPANAVG